MPLSTTFHIGMAIGLGSATAAAWVVAHIFCYM
jgi:hypothetical protein